MRRAERAGAGNFIVTVLLIITGLLFSPLCSLAADKLLSRDFVSVNLNAEVTVYVAGDNLTPSEVLKNRSNLPVSDSLMPLEEGQALWQFIDVHSVLDRASSLVVSIEKPGVDEAGVYTLDARGNLLSATFLTASEPAAEYYRQGALVIPVTLQAGVTTTLAVRLKDHGIRAFPVYLWDTRKLAERQQNNLLLFGLTMGSLTVLFGYFLLTWLYKQTRSRFWLSALAANCLLILVWVQGELVTTSGLQQHFEIIFTLLMLMVCFVLSKLTRHFFTRVPQRVLLMQSIVLGALAIAALALGNPFFTFSTGCFAMPVFTTLFALEALIYRDRRIQSLTFIYLLAWGLFMVAFTHCFTNMVNGISFDDVSPVPEILIVVLSVMALGIGAEIQERTVSDDQLSTQRRRISDLQRFYDLFRTAAEGLYTSTLDGKLKTVNPAMCAVFGYDSEGDMLKSVTNTATFYANENDRKALVAELLEKNVILGKEIRGTRTDGSEFWFSLSCQLKRESDDIYLYGSVFDITSRKEMDLSLQYLASHDSLTGAMNRREFELQLASAMQARTEDSPPVILQYLDLDRFKTVNDTCGHKAGDRLIKEVAGLLKSTLGNRGLLARLGGDEFAALYTTETEESAFLCGNKMLNAVQAYRFVWDNQVFNLGVSIGMVNSDQIDASAEHLLSLADNACYMAKRNGRNCIHQLKGNDEALQRYTEELDWVKRIQSALQSGGFELYYQPLMPLQTEAGGDYFEILVRMKGDRGQIYEPAAFLPTAERYDLSPLIDHWVVTHTLSWLGAHPVQLADLAQCNINLCGTALADENLKLQILKAFEQHNVPYSKICFEITETAAIVQMDRTLEFIRTFKQLGCKFALDDFGTGFSSYGYLRDLPVNCVKIDGSFVQDMHTSPVNKVLVSSINDVAKAIGMSTVGEYVESALAMESLRAIGVDFAQGFAIAHPAPLDNFVRL
ncbi:EAL domain-containing protein [Alteromonas sp. NFXS44]|uniref:EAL domain-containing protein n=1 Tax=Alteromonas sp. NFXS44 TaxID=2818435 RepID=UPI0032E011E9